VKRIPRQDLLLPGVSCCHDVVSDRGRAKRISAVVTESAHDVARKTSFNILNDWLTRFRILSRAPQVKPLDYRESIWRIDYLDDNAAELQPSPDKVRRRAGAAVSFTAITIGAELWEALDALPWGYNPVAADTLLLDASGSVRQVGPAIVLAFTSLETRIGYALDVLARLSGTGPGIWEWIQDRGDYRKEPSITEKFDTLLKVVARHSLKEEGRLWEGFQNLRNARNSFAHDGVAKIGKQVVGWQDAARLVENAQAILDWIDGLLPLAERRPQFAGLNQLVTSIINLMPAATPGSEMATDTNE
jgi:hypothetical protein